MADNKTTSSNVRARIKGTKIYVKPVKRSEPAFDGGSQGRRVRNWLPTGDSINSINQGSLATQRARSHDLIRKVPWAAASLDSNVSNVIGTGIRPMPRTTFPHFNAAFSEIFDIWSDESDAYGQQDFYGIQGLTYRAEEESGEAFIRLRDRKTSDGFVVPLQLQVLEGDHCPYDKNEMLSNGNKIIAGIEFDAIGRRVAYHMYPEHPGDRFGISSIQTKRIPADQIIHVYEMKRPGQIRGIPSMSTVILRMRDMLEYEDAELVRKKISTMMTGFITSPEGESGPMNEDDDDEPDDGVAMAALEPGTLQMLMPGEDIEFSSPADVGDNYDAFIKWQLRAIAAGSSTSYEQMTGDLTGVNFSSIRAGQNEIQRRQRRTQNRIIFQLCRPVRNAFLKRAVLVGAIDAPDFAFNPGPYNKIKWMAPGHRYVNPVQEVTAKLIEIRSGLMSRAQAVAELGFDVTEVDKQISEDAIRADELGLVLDSDPRHTNRSGSVADHGDEKDKSENILDRSVELLDTMSRLDAE
jgi:lambda family phage portal protein